MPLPIQSFQQIVDAQSAAMNANSQNKLDFTVGSVCLALVEANAANSIWLQALATTLLATTRLSTSSGIDVDTFIADFGFARYQGNASSGSVTFSRFTDTVQGTVPVGTILNDSVDQLTFTVTADASNMYYVPDSNSYVLPALTATLTVPAVCNTVGTIGNVTVGVINTISNPALTPGFDTVTNSSAFVNGQDPWSDTQTKTEFQLYIQSLSRATLQAIEYAVSSTNIGTQEVVTRYNIVENMNESNVTQLGYFYVVIDNGSGTTVSDTLLDAVSANVNLYRGLTIQYTVTAATFISVTIDVWVNLVAQPTETNAQIKANIVSALQAYALTIPFNQPFLYSKIGEIVYDADANVLSIPSTNAPTLNGSNSDLAGNNLQVFAVPTVTVTIL